jgi:hypothetical protein
MDPNDLSLEPCHLGVPSSCLKWFLSRWYIWCKPCTYLAPKLTLSPNEKKRDSTWPTSPRGSIGWVQMISKPIVRLTQTMPLFCVKISTISKRTELSLEPRHLEVPSGPSKMIYQPMVRLAQIMHLTWIEANTVSKEKEVRLHMTHVT